jgi:protein-S-isoprenylcysteine O-methyltransferase Ste14
MTTYAWAVIAIAVSLLPLIVLALRDPKRLRSRRSAQRGALANERRTLSIVVLVPGVVLGVLGEWPAFLIWLGSASAAGWLLVLWLARERTAPSTQS